MHEPELFEKINKGTRNGAAKGLQIVGHLIKWKPDQSDTILDFGCGPGNVLVDVVLPAFENKFSMFYATDMSEKMIEFAGKKYGNREDLKFLQMDIMKVDGFLGKFGQVDHVISSFVMHWLPDQDTGLKNVFKLLKPGGDFFSVHAQNAGVFDVYEYMDQNAKWNKYFDNLKQFVPPSHKSRAPVEDLREHLDKCGYIDIVVELIPNRVTMDNREMMITLVSSSHAQIQNIPVEMRTEYMNEFVDYGVEKGYLEVQPNTGEVSFIFNLFVVFAKKPE